MHRSRSSTPQGGVVDVERAHAIRREYLGSVKGKGELAEALLKIRSGSSTERIEGAHILKRLAPADAFGPLLAAIEGEHEKQVKIELLRALHWSIEPDGASLPEDAIPRLEKVITGETDPDVVTEAAMAVYHCSDRPDADSNLTGIRGRIDDALGETHPVSCAITKVLVQLRQSD
jgi:hypothetical protein